MTLMKKYFLGMTALAGLLFATTAQAVVIDTFSGSPGQINVAPGCCASGGDQWLNGTDTTGYARQVHARDAHSGTIAGAGNLGMTVTGSPSSFPPAPAGVLEWWGGTSAPDNFVQYGTAINAGAGGDNTALDIHGLTLSDTIEIDIANQPSDTNMGIFSVIVYTGTDGGGSGGTFIFNTGTQPGVGTLSIALSNFGAITANDAADIDGLKIQTAASYFVGAGNVPGTPQGGGVQISEVRIGAAVPEPSSMVLAGLGLVGLGFFGLRRRKS